MSDLPSPAELATRLADVSNSPDFDSECVGMEVDTTVHLSLAELFLQDPDEIMALFKKKIGTDEMGGLEITAEKVIDDDTVAFRVKGTVDEYARGQID